MDAITIYLGTSLRTMVLATKRRESSEQDLTLALAHQIMDHALRMTALIISIQALLAGHFLASNLSSQQK